MSLSSQIRAILRASASEAAPLKASDIRERLIALGVTDVEDIYKRLSLLVHRGEIVTTGEARGKGYWMSDRFTPAPAAKRHKRPDGVPSLTQRVLDIVTATPGVMTAQITAQLQADGVELREGQPSTCISRLHDRGQLRSEGTRQRRGYFVVTDRVKGAKAQADAQDRSTPCGPGQAATEAPSPASIPRTEGSAVTAGKDRHISDDPIDRLADAIQQHLELTEPWITSTLVAEDLDEEPVDVARALRRLVDAKRANVRTIGGVREYAVGVEWDPEATPAATSIETGPLSDTNGPISIASLPPPLPETQTGTGAGASKGAALAPIAVDDDNAHPPSRHCMCVECCKAFEPTPSAIPPPAYSPAEVRFVPSDIAAARAALSPAHQTTATRIEHLLDIADAAKDCDRLDQSIGWVLRDVEDLVGRACDHRADHRAIKAMTTAAFALGRAIEHLHTVGTTPAPTGVPQS